MKRLLCVILSACMLTISVYSAPASPVLNLQAASAVLMERETGTILYEQNPDEKLEPASVTKIMTLLLIFEALLLELGVDPVGWAWGLGGLLLLG